MILQVDGVVFRYKSDPVLMDITFGVDPGETVMILGPNGAGKSTLLRCLNALLHPHAGEVLLNGRCLRNLSGPEVARTLGYVPQRCEPNRLTAFDAILLGRRPHIRWKVADRDLQIVDAIIRNLGMEELALRYLDEMSGGEIQKVTIARALAQDPQVLLLDEPTSSLDLKNQVEILDLLHHIVRGHGMAAVLTLHDLNTAFRYGDRFLFMKDGKIVHAIRREEVTRDVIEEVYGLPVELEFIRGIPVVLPGGPWNGSPCVDETRQEPKVPALSA